jgi:hypothetical protein
LRPEFGRGLAEIDRRDEPGLLPIQFLGRGECRINLAGYPRRRAKGRPIILPACSYRPEIDDGATSVLNWSGLDATVNSASNPVQPIAGVGCDPLASPACLLVASSTGVNAWYKGQATRLTCSATCVAGLTSGQLYYAWPSSEIAQRDLAQTTYVALFLTPSGNEPGSLPMTTAQGSGTSSFSFRVQHYHWSTWQTLDALPLALFGPLELLGR